MKSSGAWEKIASYINPPTQVYIPLCDKSWNLVSGLLGGTSMNQRLKKILLAVCYKNIFLQKIIDWTFSMISPNGVLLVDPSLLRLLMNSLDGQRLSGFSPYSSFLQLATRPQNPAFVREARLPDNPSYRQRTNRAESIITNHLYCSNFYNLATVFQ